MVRDERTQQRLELGLLIGRRHETRGGEHGSRRVGLDQIDSFWGWRDLPFR